MAGLGDQLRSLIVAEMELETARETGDATLIHHWSKKASTIWSALQAQSKGMSREKLEKKYL